MKIKIDLRDFFKKEAKLIIASYKRLLANRQGVGVGTAMSIDRAPSNAPATIRKKGKDHWMVDTGETKSKGFDSSAYPKRLIVFASRAKHSGRHTQMLVPEGSKRRKGQSRIPTRRVIRQSRNRPTYEQIFGWNNTAGGRYGGVFMKLPKGMKTFVRMEAEIFKQTNDQIRKQLKAKYKIA